ncbi:hypothetical protein SCH01S_20_00080 [Sphingomonas changbaiensis NBRC 104936]|uniref:Twin-arginine translocation pathway signal n=1 Tax=Sphingomonas changbaiensis NBRC 104936 TaxID=1219043 RepID=A0A0E9MMY7_9SPHN|nr:DUF885 family protein [Sphingomonas changbaiensis]GAO38801.1 hypothetical protein SCH01S_20_00080 [Sphingomonas changbaiensis NBRC 104936]
MDFARRDLLAASAAATAYALLPGRAFAADSAADARASKLLDGITEQMLRDFPESATGLGIDKGARAALKSQLTDTSEAGKERLVAHLRTGVNQLKPVNLDALSPTMRTNVEVVQTAFGLALDGYAFPYGVAAVGGYLNSPYVVAQNVGSYLNTPKMLDSDHLIETTADAGAYLARMNAYAGQLDGETERLKAARGMGVIAPDFLIDKTLKALDVTRQGTVEDWGIVTSIAKRTAKMKGDYAARAAQIARTKVGPALERQIAEMQLHRAKATSDAGVWKLPHGDEYYAWALRAGTTTPLSPQEIHQMGLDQVRELQAQMDVILKGLGYSQGTVGARMTALGKDPRFTFPNNDEGRAQIIKLLQDRIAHIRALMPQAFNTLVKGNVEVKRLPLAEEPGAAGAYGGPGSIDGKIPSRLWINLGTTERWTTYSLPDLAYHEAIPGHGWQGEYTFKLPLIRSLLAFNAYSEGWALYAEQLADELGVYKENPVERLGYLQSLSFRACRLVVDSGLHAKRWTRQQAIDWFANTNGSSIEEVSAEVDRYCSWPGQACGYKVGHTYINRLRDKAKAELGPRFDLKTFDDALVLGGNVPMTVLEGVVDRYIASRKA